MVLNVSVRVNDTEGDNVCSSVHVPKLSVNVALSCDELDSL